MGGRGKATPFPCLTERLYACNVEGTKESQFAGWARQLCVPRRDDGVVTLAFVTRCQVAINKFLYILLRSSKLGKHLLTARLNY